MSDDCVFCRIVANEESAKIVATYDDALVLVPLNPVTKGHVIVIPKVHVSSAVDNHHVSGYVMVVASSWADDQVNLFGDTLYESVNFITSVGKPATQSVFHLHMHIVPRAINDGLALPWHSGKSKISDL